MNQRNVKRTMRPGVCAGCANCRDWIESWHGMPRRRYWCVKRPIVAGRKPCELYKGKDNDKGEN